jgi:hypothetical protein
MCSGSGWRPRAIHWPLWSVVFPLGMYSVATLAFGRVAHLAFMEPLGRFMLWAALAAWVAVAAAFAVRIWGASGLGLSGNHDGMTGRLEQRQPLERS